MTKEEAEGLEEGDLYRPFCGWRGEGLDWGWGEIVELWKSSHGRRGLREKGGLRGWWMEAVCQA